MRVLRLGLMVLLATVGVVAQANAGGLTLEDQLRWDAARALYGEGLTVSKTSSGVSIAPDKKKPLTQERFNQFVEIYLEALQTVSAQQRGTSFKWQADYADPKYAPRAAVKLGWLLLEPAFKYQLCKTIIGRIDNTGDAAPGWDRGAWCVQQGVIDATTNTCVYRGGKSDCSAAEDHGALELEEPIFVKGSDGNYPILVTVSGGRDLITKGTINIAERMMQNLVSASKLTPKIQADWKARLTKFFAAEKAADKKQRKLAKNQLAFSDQPFFKWEVRKPAKSVSCKTVHTVLYAPAKKLANDYYYEVRVDGALCDEHPLGAGETARDNIHLTERCRNLLDQGASHKVAITLHEMVIGASSTKRELKDGQVKDVKYDWGKAGKKLFGGSVSCSN